MDFYTAPEIYGGIISSACNIQVSPIQDLPAGFKHFSKIIVTKPGNNFFFFLNLTEKKRSLSLSHLCQIFHVIFDLDQDVNLFLFCL